MNLLSWFRRDRSRPAILIGLTLLTGGLFKLSAFAREAFIAARFGFSPITDTYFGLQQFPLTLATFMFGSFALAFTPAYANASRNTKSVSWLPGLTLYGSLMGGLMTILMLAAAPWLLRLFSNSPSAATWQTLAILSLCYVPVFYIGILAGVLTAQGKNLSAMSLAGFPYLLMTLTLFLLYATGTLNNLGLPISMAIGFAAVGLFAFVSVIRLNPGVLQLRLLSSTWNMPGFRTFLRALTTSSIENLGYAGNQLLILFFLARAGTGAISANTCGMRIGMLGYSLLAQPLAQLVQSRLCAGEPESRRAVFGRWLFVMASGVILMAAVLYASRMTVIRVVYMHGRFQNAELNQVVSILPAWIGYFVVMSLNAIVSRYLFTDGNGGTYVRRQLGAYGAANLLRFAIGNTFGPASIIWCSVLTESAALLFNLRTCLAVPSVESISIPALLEKA